MTKEAQIAADAATHAIARVVSSEFRKLATLMPAHQAAHAIHYMLTANMLQVLAYDHTLAGSDGCMDGMKLAQRVNAVMQDAINQTLELAQEERAKPN